LRDLFRQLETLVQSHTETKLKLYHNGIKIYKPITRCPTNTKIHTLERQKRHYFRLIQQYVDKHIDVALHTKNALSALFKRNRLQLDNKRYNDGAGSSEGRGDNFPHPTLPAHPPRSQPSQIQKLHQPQATTQATKMPHTQLEAVHDVQADILSTLKDTSYFKNDTTPAPSH
jgi:hypothetical protein